MTGLDTRRFREKLKLTQKEFAALFEVPYGTVVNWDYRQNMPKFVNAMIWNYYRELRNHAYLSCLSVGVRDDAKIQERMVEIVKEEFLSML